MKKYFIIIALYYIVWLGFHLQQKPQAYSLVTRFLDVGQGDAILIEYNHRKVLVDAGPGTSIEKYLPTYFAYPFCNIDLAIISHLHEDHMSGFIPLINDCKFGAFWFNDVPLTSRVYSNFKQLITENNQKISIKSSTLAGLIYKKDELAIYTLWPTANFYKNFKPNQDLNQLSVVLFVDYKDFEMLLTGDAESIVLDQLDLSRILPLVQGKLDVLKIPHHGSAGGLSLDFLHKINPKDCVISVGKANKYGHPAANTVSLLQEFGCNIYRTADEGTIEFGVD